MEDSMLYPEGWRYREFVGNLRNAGPTAKRTRTDGKSLVDQVIVEEEQKRQDVVTRLQQEVVMLRQQAGLSPADNVAHRQGQQAAQVAEEDDLVTPHH